MEEPESQPKPKVQRKESKKSIHKKLQREKAYKSHAARRRTKELLEIQAELDQSNSWADKIQITIDDTSQQLTIDYDALFAEETHERYVSFNDGNGVPIAHYVFTYELQSSGDYSITFAPVNYERKTIYIQTKEADVKE